MGHNEFMVIALMPFISILKGNLVLYCVALLAISIEEGFEPTTNITYNFFSMGKFANALTSKFLIGFRLSWIDSRRRFSRRASSGNISIKFRERSLKQGIKMSQCDQMME